jgi:hypothetical protein
MQLRVVCAGILLAVAAATSARAQRLQLPSRLEPATTAPAFQPNSSVAPSSNYLPPGGGSTFTPAPSYSSGSTGATFSGGIQAFDPYATTAPQTVFQPGAITTQPVLPATPTPVLPPAGTIPVIPNGAAAPIVTPAPAPYYAPGAPYTTSPPALYPNGLPTIAAPTFPDMSNIKSVTRFLQEIRLQHEWIFDDVGATGVEVNSSEVSATFAVPLFGLQTPFLITPGFGLHLWDGPVSLGPGTADLPGQTYDAWLDVGWNPQVNNWFGAELGVRTGVYTDFEHFSNDSIRVMGRGLGVVRITPTMQIKAGLIYIDRNDIKMLPAGGLIWDPGPDRHYEFFFPRPKLAHRWTTLANHTLWYYVAGEYGGGAWTIVRDAGFVDAFDYNDLRALLGLEWLPEAQSGMRGFVEVGYVFNRELFYVSQAPPPVELDDTFMFRGGIAF